MTPLLELRDITVDRGGHTILDVPHFEVARDQTLAILGPNGAGKSTLLRTAALLTRPTTGQVLLDGHQADERALRAASAAVLQRPLLRRGTVLDNVASGLRFRGRTRTQAREQAEPWLDQLGIAHLAARQARTLSGGEGQRVSIARALATTPQLLLLDEPFAALDETSRARLITDVRDLLTTHQITTLHVTHDRREAAALAHHIVVLNGGRILAEGTTTGILNNPAAATHIGGDSLLDDALAAHLHNRPPSVPEHRRPPPSTTDP
jgi:tungstate transport system ATP-binding protein